MRSGVRLGIDVGSVRVGLARSDRDGLLATPERTLHREGDEPGPAELDEIAALVREVDAVEVVVGLPLSLSGGQGRAAATARGYAEAVARRVAPVTVRLVDERLSTVSASRSLREAGRRERSQRSVVDQAAAVVILQSALDAERVSGRPPGEPVPTRPDQTRSGVEEQR